MLTDRETFLEMNSEAVAQPSKALIFNGRAWEEFDKHPQDNPTTHDKDPMSEMLPGDLGINWHDLEVITGIPDPVDMANTGWLMADLQGFSVDPKTELSLKEKEGVPGSLPLAQESSGGVFYQIPLDRHVGWMTQTGDGRYRTLGKDEISSLPMPREDGIVVFQAS